MKYTSLFTLLLTIFFTHCASHMDESAAIIQVLEKESATWRAGDFEGHAACWHVQLYSKILISTTEGRCIDVPAQVMTDPATKMGDGGSSANSNYQISVYEKSAWVSHDEVSTAKDGTKTYSHEIRLMEKVGGDWKLVGQSIHQYVP